MTVQTVNCHLRHLNDFKKQFALMFYYFLTYLNSSPCKFSMLYVNVTKCSL